MGACAHVGVTWLSRCGWGAGARNPGHWHTVPEPHDTGPNGSFDLRRGGLGVLKYRQQTPPFCALGMCGCTACGAHPAAANGPACLHAGGTAGVPALFPSHLTCPLRTTLVDCLHICAPNGPIHKKTACPPAPHWPPALPPCCLQRAQKMAILPYIFKKTPAPWYWNDKVPEFRWCT